MTVPNTLEKEEEMPRFRVIRGGKGPPGDDTTPNNWLEELPVGSVFTCCRKGMPPADSFVSGCFGILFKHGKTTVMTDCLSNQDTRILVRTEAFSKVHELLDLLQKGEADNAHDLRTIRHRRVENDADVEGGQQTDGEA